MGLKVFNKVVNCSGRCMDYNKGLESLLSCKKSFFVKFPVSRSLSVSSREFMKTRRLSTEYRRQTLFF